MRRRTEMEPNEMTNEERKNEAGQVNLPGWEKIQAELSSAKSIDDFFGREGIFARLLSKTLEQMLEAELTAHLGYGKYEAFTLESVYTLKFFGKHEADRIW